MAGDVKVAVVSGQVSTSPTGTADFTVSGFGTPKACIVLLSHDTTDNASVETNQPQSIGLSDFTGQFCVAHQDENGSAKVDCDAIKSNTKAYIHLSISGLIFLDGTVSTIADGVRLTNTSNTLGRAAFATVIMFGGADLAIDLSSTVINPTQNLTAAIAHSGFTDGNDKVVFFIGTDIVGEDARSLGINSAFGVCHATGSDAGGWTFVQRCIGWASDHNNAAGSPAAIISTDRVLDIITEAGGQDWGLEVTGLDHSPAEWTVTTRDAGSGAGMEVYSLSLDLDDRKAKVGSVDSPTTGATWTPGVALGFTPQYVGLGLTHLPTEDTIATDADSGAIGFSFNTGSGEEACQSWYNEDAAPTIATHALFRSRAIDFRNDDVVTVVHDHSHSSFNDGDWTYTINTENETTAKKWFYLAIEEAGGAGPFTAEGVQTLPSLTQAAVGVMQPSGTAAQTLAALIQAGVGEEKFIATGAQTLAALIQAGIGVEKFTATGIQLLTAILQSGVGVMQPSGTAAQILAALLQAGAGEEKFIATAVQTLAALTQAGEGVHIENLTGTAAQALAALTQSGVGLMKPSGAGAQVLAALLQAGVGEEKFTSTAAQTLAALLQSGIGATQPSGVGAQNLSALLQAGAGSEQFVATGAQVLAAITQAGIGLMQPSGVGVQTLAAVVQSASGAEILVGVGAQVLAALLQAGAGEETFTATGVQVLAPLTQVGVGVEKLIATAAQTLASLLQSGVGNVPVGAPPLFGTGVQTLPRLIQIASAGMQPSGVGVQILPAITQLATVVSVIIVVSGVGKVFTVRSRFQVFKVAEGRIRFIAGP